MSTDKITLSAVSYLNTKPFLWGIEQSGLAEKLNITLDIPAKTAEKLLQNQVDAALVPVGILPQLPSYQLITNYCIGALNRVRTVCLYSQQPLQNITHVLLDYQSCTSVRLVQILFKYYWKQSVSFAPASPNFETQLQGSTAGVIIGDRAIAAERQYPYVYDLSEAWHAFTGLPFVFAAWVSRRPINPDLIADLNRAFAYGIDHLPQVAALYTKVYDGDFDVYNYLSQNISYAFDDEKRKALDLFLHYISVENLSPVSSHLVA